jgi:hypothetical protein
LRVLVAGAQGFIGRFIAAEFVGIALPSVWFEPFGGLLKNISLIPAVGVLGVLSSRR